MFIQKNRKKTKHFYKYMLKYYIIDFQWLKRRFSFMNEKEKNVSKRSVRKNTKSTKQNKKPRKLGNFSAAIISIIAICLICATVACTYVLKFANDYVNGEKKIDLDEYKANQAQTSIIYGYDENKELVELLRLYTRFLIKKYV